VVALGILIGRGLGLAGNEKEPAPSPPHVVPSPAGEPQRPNAAPSAPGSAHAGAAQPAGTDAGRSSLGSTGGSFDDPNGAPQPGRPVPAGPLGETHVVVGAAPAGAPASGGAQQALEADRFHSALSLLGEQTTLGDLAAAVQTLAHLRSCPLDGAQRTALLAPAKTLEDALTSRCTQVVQHVVGGRVLQARALAQALSVDGRTLPGDWFQAAWAAVGHKPPWAPSEPTARPAGSVPLPKALPRGRAVRVAFGPHVGEGTVADSRADVATIRLAKDSGFVFPTVPVASLEPFEPTADEALEMAFAALQHDDPMLARLWQWCAATRRAPQAEPSDRARLLANWLR
jgi:hypothetical protein